MALYQRQPYGDSPCDYTHHCPNCDELQLDHELTIRAAQDSLQKLMDHLYNLRPLNEWELADVVEDLAHTLNIRVTSFHPFSYEVK